MCDCSSRIAEEVQAMEAEQGAHVVSVGNVNREEDRRTRRGSADLERGIARTVLSKQRMIGQRNETEFN